MKKYDKSEDSVQTLIVTLQDLFRALVEENIKAVYTILESFGLMVCNEEAFTARILSRNVLDDLIKYHTKSGGVFDNSKGNLVVQLAHRQLLDFFQLSGDDIVELFADADDTTVIAFMQTNYHLDHETLIELIKVYVKEDGNAKSLINKCYHLLSKLPASALVEIAKIFVENRDLGWFDVDPFEEISVQVTW